MMQGFACDTDPAVAQAAPWLRLTPAVSTVWIVTALVLRSPTALWIFAGLAALGAGGLHLFDQAVNVVQRARGAPTLPANPAPRRFAMALAAGMSAVSGLLIARGYTALGVLLGSTLALAALIVASTHFCLGSWMWAQLQHGVGALKLFLIATLVVLSAIACSESVVCTADFRYGISVSVEDSVSGASVASGARLVVRDGAYFESTSQVWVGDVLLAAGERPGLYIVVVSKSGYRDWTRTNVRVEDDGCHPVGVHLTARLQPE